MGGSGSKQAQLERFGQLLSSQEEESLSRCFFAITGVQQADAFEEDKLQVAISALYAIYIQHRWVEKRRCTDARCVYEWRKRCVFNNSSCQTTKLNFVAIVLPLYYKQNLKRC